MARGVIARAMAYETISKCVERNSVYEMADASVYNGTAVIARNVLVRVMLGVDIAMGDMSAEASWRVLL